MPGTTRRRARKTRPFDERGPLGNGWWRGPASIPPVPRAWRRPRQVFRQGERRVSRARCLSQSGVTLAGVWCGSMPPARRQLQTQLPRPEPLRHGHPIWIAANSMPLYLPVFRVTTFLTRRGISGLVWRDLNPVVPFCHGESLGVLREGGRQMGQDCWGSVDGSASLESLASSRQFDVSSKIVDFA